MNKQELLSKVRTSRVRFETEIGQVPSEQMTEPNLDNGWSIKDMLAHIGFWEKRAADLLETLQQGKTLEDEPDIDSLNASVYAQYHDRPLDEVVHWEHRQFDNLLDEIENSSDSDLFNPNRFAWTEGVAFYEWIAGNTYGHYDEHLAALRKWLAA
jgi:hypothetical protein